jgi:hypothetical protein
MPDETELLLYEYREVNAHLRANMSQFVGWFSLFLTFSLAAAFAFFLGHKQLSAWNAASAEYAVPAVFVVLHVLAFAGILTFRRYIIAAHCRIEEIIKEVNEGSASPIPARFYKWMTNLMAAGFVVSYFGWFLQFFVR